MCDNNPTYVPAVNPPPQHDQRGLDALRELTHNGLLISDPRCQTLLSLLSNNVNQQPSSTVQHQQPDHRVSRPQPHINPSLPMHRIHDPPSGHSAQHGHDAQPRDDPGLSTVDGYQDEPIQAQSFFPRGGHAHPSSQIPPLSRAHPTQGVPHMDKHFLPHQQSYPVHQGYTFSNPHQDQYHQLQWDQQRREPEHGVPYLQPARTYPYPIPQPQNVHASYSHHIVPQPALSHTPNHAFSFEDSQHAIVARRLMIDEEVATRANPQPSLFDPGYQPRAHSGGSLENLQQQYNRDMHSAQQPMLDPSQHFVEMYSPRAPQRRNQLFPGGQLGKAPPSAPGHSAQQISETQAEQQLRALDLLSLQAGNGLRDERPNPPLARSVPNENPSKSHPYVDHNPLNDSLPKLGGPSPSSGSVDLALMPSKEKLDIPTLSAHEGQSDHRTRTGLDFLLTAENITPQAPNAPPVDSTELTGNEGLSVRNGFAPSNPTLGLNLVNEFIPDLPNGNVNFGSDTLLENEIKDFSLEDVSAADSVFRAATSAVSKETAQNAANTAGTTEAKAPRNPRKPKQFKPKEPKKLKDPKPAKEKKPKRPRQPKKPSQPKSSSDAKSCGTLPNPPHEPSTSNSNAASERLKSIVATPAASSLADVVPSDLATGRSAKAVAKSDENGKPKKRKRKPKKSAKAAAASEQAQKGLVRMESKGVAIERIIEQGQPPSHSLSASQTTKNVQGRGRSASSEALSQIYSTVSGSQAGNPVSFTTKGAALNPNGVIPGPFPGPSVSQVTLKRPMTKKTSEKNEGSTSSLVMNRLQSRLQQRVEGVQLSQIFQIKAQLDAFRRISRGAEPPTEVTIASGGARPMSGDVVNGLIVPTDFLRKGMYQADSARNCVVPGVPSQSQQSSAAFSKPISAGVSENERLNTYGKQALEAARKQRADMQAQRHANAVALQLRADSLTKQAHAIDSSVIASESSANVPLSRVQVSGHKNVSVARPNSILNGLPTPRTLTKDHEFAPSTGTKAIVAPTAKAKRAPRKTRNALGVGKSTIVKKTASRCVALQNTAAPVTITAPQYNGKAFRELLFEREQRINMRIQRRHNELAQLPPDIPEDIRRRAIIEKKQLNLLALQRKARASVTDVMHALFTKGNSVLVGADSINRFRRPTPTHWSWRNPGASVQTNGGTLSAAARKSVQKLERKHREEQEMRRRSRQVALCHKLLVHVQDYRSHQSARLVLHKKLMKDLDRYFSNRARKEEQRRKKENHDRLRALRENNEDEYLKLVKSTKNKRLLQLLKQTDEYLSQIGAQVERQKEAAKREDAAENEKSVCASNEIAHSSEAEQAEKDEDDDEDLKAMKQRRNEYYTVTHTVKEKVFQPKTLVGGSLKPYQIEGLEWLVSLYNNNLNGILADEMGLGKTIQTLSLITYLVEVKQVTGPYLVIVPLSTMSNWVRELERWAPSLTKVVYRGDPATRRSIQHREMSNGGYNVLLTTYEFVVRDKTVLGKIKWKYIIIDEGHRMKNSDCKLAITLGSKYQSRNRILLTGTPLQNNLTELWALLNFLLPTIFSNSDTFETWFNAPFQAASLGGSAELNEEENLLVISRLHQVLRPFMLRRLKTDVDCQLPDKVEEVFKCEMSVWQRVLYRQMRAKLGIAAGGSTGSTRSFNNMVMQLKKVCNHPYLFYQDEELASLPHDYLIRTSGKFELLNHALRKLKATGHRVLMFSQMTAALDYLELFLMNIGIKCLRLDGTTKAEDRQEMLEQFNAKESPYFCFLLSTRAGGLGLNLQTADTVIIFDSDWNPMMDLQAQDRAHRIGQTKEVRVIRLICSGSIEVKILERANEKLKMDAQVIQAGQFNNKSSDNDRQEMLKDILRNQGDDDDLYKSDISSLESINRMLARTDEELELFEEMDRERLEIADRQGRPPLMVDESEIPAWVLQPEVEQKSKEQLEAEYIEQHGRGRRKRKAVTYEDNLTEREWTQAIEEDGYIDEAVLRKKRKLSRSQSQSDDDEYTDGRSSAKKLLDVAKEDSVAPSPEPSGIVASVGASFDRESSSSVPPTKLEPFVDPDLHKPVRPRRGRGRPKKYL